MREALWAAVSHHCAMDTLHTFRCLAVPYHEGPNHVARAKELPLRILPADVLEKPPAAEPNEPRNAAVGQGWGQHMRQERGQHGARI